VVHVNTIGDTVTAYVTTLLGIGWGMYLLLSAGVVGATLAVEHVRAKGRNDG
jgi:hypothetical protein